MRFHSFCTLLTTAVALSLTAIPAAAQTVTTPILQYPGGRPVVSVKINGVGPYDFILDTGATGTVLDTTLFHDLNLTPEGSVNISTSAGAGIQTISTAQSISVDTLSLPNLQVVGMTLALGADFRGIRGILGENFLQNFDILIDNQHQKVTLDSTPSLAASLAGEHLPITFPPVAPTEQKKYRPTVSIRLESAGARQLTVLLDSGAAHLMLFNSTIDTLHALQTVKMTTVNGSAPCLLAGDDLHWGKSTVSGLPQLTCLNNSTTTRPYQGVLPTALFKQIFISHSGTYALINPKRLATPAPTAAIQTAAIATPSAPAPADNLR
jgi:predicted aspartyl protease